MLWTLSCSIFTAQQNILFEPWKGFVETLEIECWLQNKPKLILGGAAFEKEEKSCRKWPLFVQQKKSKRSDCSLRMAFEDCSEEAFCIGLRKQFVESKLKRLFLFVLRPFYLDSMPDRFFYCCCLASCLQTAADTADTWIHFITYFFMFGFLTVQSDLLQNLHSRSIQL